MSFETKSCLDALTAPADRTEIIDILRVERLRRLAAADATEFLPRREQTRAPEDQTHFPDSNCPRETIGAWSARSAITMPWGRVLYRLARWSGGPVLEIGTGAGVSAAYISAGLDHSTGSITTIEPDERLVQAAITNLGAGAFEHVIVCKGSQEQDAETLIRRHQPRLVHIDSDHRYAGITAFAQMLFDTVTTPTIVCYDDIRWSAGMARFWSKVWTGAYGTRLAVDLGGWGIAVIDPPTAAHCGTIIAKPPSRFEGVRIEGQSTS